MSAAIKRVEDFLDDESGFVDYESVAELVCDYKGLQKRLTELEARVPKWNDGLPEKKGVYLVEKPSSQYHPYAVDFFDGKNFGCPHQYIGRWMVIPKEQGDE